MRLSPSQTFVFFFPLNFIIIDFCFQGAVNVPAFAKTDMGMLPMSSTFNKLVGITFPDKQTKLVVGCQVLGVRGGNRKVGGGSPPQEDRI